MRFLGRFLKNFFLGRMLLRVWFQVAFSILRGSDALQSLRFCLSFGSINDRAASLRSSSFSRTPMNGKAD
jgi:hypothetical protein